MSDRSALDLFRDDLRNVGGLLVVAGVIGLLIEPGTVRAGAVIVLGAWLWGSAYVINAQWGQEC